MGCVLFVHPRVPRGSHADGDVLSSLDFTSQRDAIYNDYSYILEMAAWFNGDNVVLCCQPAFCHLLSCFTLIASEGEI